MRAFIHANSRAQSHALARTVARTVAQTVARFRTHSRTHTHDHVYGDKHGLIPLRAFARARLRTSVRVSVCARARSIAGDVRMTCKARKRKRDLVLEGTRPLSSRGMHE